MQTSAKHCHAKISAQKCRLVADQIRGLAVDKAITTLNVSNKKAAELILKVVESAIANAKHNEGTDNGGLKV